MSKKRPITENERKMLALLNRKVRFLPGSWDKRFCQNLGSAKELTVKQSLWVGRVFHKYRNQIRGHEQICPECKQEPEQLEMDLQ